MREAMYGWMTLHLKQQGDGKPIAEPKLTIDSPEDLACFPDGKRPDNIPLPADAGGPRSEATAGLAERQTLDHKEAWESRAVLMRAALDETLGKLPDLLKSEGTFGKTTRMQACKRPH